MSTATRELNLALAGRYVVREELGRGATAIVYLAEDVKHRRPVAVKVLRPEIAATVGANAFLQEIEIAGRLAHPHIVPLYDSGQAHDYLFYTMPHVEGESLRRRLDADGQLPIDEAVRIAREVADALFYAHNHGVLHRDIKPENILLHEGHAVVTDFGLATALGRAAAVETPEPALAVGTPLYMSPEQASGGRVLDSRADIYALGSVLFEMLIGEPPYRGATIQALLAQKAMAPTPGLRLVRETVPDYIEAAVHRALAKAPADRFRTAAEFRDALAAADASRPRPALPDPSIAVLPFQHLGAPEQEYFTAGITEEITSRLARVKALSVISRNSANQYAKTDKTTRQIGEELGVRYVLEGAVRWAGGENGGRRVRVTPQLIRAEDETHMWADTYDRVLTDIFDLQSDIAHRVVDQLGVTLLEPERRAITRRRTENLEAYHAYLQGQYHLGRPDYSPATVLQAIQGFERATELDPAFALAFAELAKAHAMLFHFGHDVSEERRVMARDAVDRAAALAPDAPEVQLAAGFYHYLIHRDYDKALDEFALAERQLPKNEEVLTIKGGALRRRGRWEEGLLAFQRAFELNPRDARAALEVGATFMYTRRYHDAMVQLDHSIDVAPEQTFAYVLKAWNHWLWKGSSSEARLVLDVMPANTDDSWAAWAWFWQEVYEGRYAEALGRMAPVSGDWIRTFFFDAPTSLFTAFAHELLDDRKAARKAYERARTLLEGQVGLRPHDRRLHGALGIVYAGLKRRDDALREATRAVELFPVSKDATYGPASLEELAITYTMLGEHDAAIDQIEILLARPALVSAPLLRLSPRWTPLRDHPRFERLVGAAQPR